MSQRQAEREKVLELYYGQKLYNAAKISKILGLNPRTVQRYVKNDPRYNAAKEERKAIAAEKRKKAAVKCVRLKRQEKEKEMNDIVSDFFANITVFDLWETYTEFEIAKKRNTDYEQIVDALGKNERYRKLVQEREIAQNEDIVRIHIQDVLAMSKSAKVSDSDLLRYTPSAYIFCGNEYVYNAKAGLKPADLREKITISPFFTYAYSSEKQRIEEEKHNSIVEGLVLAAAARDSR